MGLKKKLMRGCFLLAAGCSMFLLQSSAAAAGAGVKALVLGCQWRSSQIDYAQEVCGGDYGGAGNIELITVLDGAVTKVDTIWNRKNGLAQYPAFNFDAQKVAFYRFGIQSGSGSACAVSNGGKYTVSVMNKDGSNVQNLVEIPGIPFVEMALAWPVGKWIYYIKPRLGNIDLDRMSCEIRKVDYTVGASSDVAVYTYPTVNNKYIRRFDLNAQGNFASLQSYPIPGFTAIPSQDLNGVIAFPPTSGVWPT